MLTDVLIINETEASGPKDFVIWQYKEEKIAPLQEADKGQ